MSVNFGFKKVSKDKKEALVQNVFTKVASHYDLMNDLMSFGLHRNWKNKFIEEIDFFKEKTLIDLAGGTGDIAKRFINNNGKKAVVCDLNQEMLNKGKYKINNAAHSNKIKWINASAEKIPFKDNTFDYCTISFGIRNVTNIDNVLKESFRVLKPGGKFLCLEFSKIDNNVINKFYNFYSFKIIPKIGSVIANSKNSYQYLVESINQFHTPDELKAMMINKGYFSVDYKKLFFGVVAIHSGYKI